AAAPVLCAFFFSSRRRHTRSKRDWSSDVCASDLVLSGNPLAGERLDLDRSLTSAKASRGGVAIDAAAHERLLVGLLAMDAAEGVAAPRRGPVTREARVARRENVRIATLIQMTMGLRITEVRTLTWDRVLDVQGNLS